MSGDFILLYIPVYHKWTSYDIWFLKCKVGRIEIFVILGHFLPFQHPGNLENQIFKIEKNTWRYYHLTHLHHTWKSYDVCFLRYGAWQIEFFVILDSFLCPFTAPPSSLRPYSLTTQKVKVLKKWKNFLEILSFYTDVHKWQSYDVWFLRYRACWTEFFVILYPFLPFYPPNNLKSWKKAPGDIIILQWYTKNHDHMLYCSWDMTHNRCNCYFSFWAIFCPFTSLTAWKIKIF